jgi:hypothetical protein
MSVPIVGAVLLSTFQLFVLSSDSDASGSSKDVSPISVPPLMWKGQIWNSDDIQVQFDCLLMMGLTLF